MRLGRYDLVRKIAAGGMAEIFLARHWGEGGFFQDVVIKRLFRHLAENQRQLRMFLDEARLLSQLSHPNIPQAYDVGFSEGFWFFAMEYVEGLTVADLWRQGSKAGVPMPLNVALAIVAQACEALHHAHERHDRAGQPLRIVHRDVTPHNIMLTRDGVGKVMDFGVAATSARQDTDVGAVRGTFAYMAPEQVRGRPLDKRADVFALGVVLYELTTGTRLFRGTDVQIMTAVVEKSAQAPSERLAGYPKDLEEIVLAALDRDRGSRIPSAGRLATYIEEFAIRHALPIGPRAVAQYVAAAVPSERIVEEGLGLVESGERAERPTIEWSAHETPGWAIESDDSLPSIDEAAVLDDLDLLSAPLKDLPAPPDPAAPRDEEHEFGDTTDRPSEIEAADDLNHLVLDSVDDESVDPPVVLLEPSDRKVRPSGDALEAEYVNELERRLGADEES